MQAVISERLSRILARIGANEALSSGEQESFLNELEAFECWNAYFRLLNRNITDPKMRQIVDYVRMARAQNRCLENVFAASETCTRMVSDLKLDFNSFAQEALPKIVAENDYGAEAVLLQGVLNVLPTRGDKIACLERLCLIYEKKHYDEVRLNENFKKLIEIDPRNQKALKYFKIIFTQNHEWDDVVRILQVLLEDAHKIDRFRLALELASVYLYHLDQPHMAISVIERFCSDSPLDSSTILFDAYRRIQNWDGCLKVLRECLLKVETDQSRAIIYYKVGELEERKSSFEAAFDSYLKSNKLFPGFLEPLERSIELSLQLRDWQRTLDILSILKGQLKNRELVHRVEELQARLQNGLQNA